MALGWNIEERDRKNETEQQNEMKTSTEVVNRDRDRKNSRLTFVIAGGEHSLICRTGTNMPYLPSLVQEDSLIDDIIFIIKVNDVDLEKKQRERRDVFRMKLELKYCMLRPSHSSKFH